MKEIKSQDILSGDIRTLSKAITLSESKKLEHQELAHKLIEEVLDSTGKSKRIGISGTPGVGKSTFIENLGLMLCEAGHKVAVLAVDPSSPISGGSILGDKTRMEKLSQHPNAYIRPTPNSGTLGGVAQKTREAMLLCEAAGFEIILIETVGVGQSEFEVSDMVDLFVVLLLPGGGDELQGIKKGIIEVADYILINKSEGENKTKAKTTQNEYISALNIITNNKSWKPKVELISAQNNTGLDVFWSGANEYFSLLITSNSFESKRLGQNKKWFKKLFNEMILSKISQDDDLQKTWHELEEKINSNKSTPFASAKKMIRLLFK